jgi:hypothetical protein
MSNIARKVLWSIGLSIPSAAIGVILRGVFQAWGIFDPFSQWLGGWLKMHITTAQVEWTVAAGMALLAYAGLLWIVWRYHRAPTPIIIGDQANFRGEVASLQAEPVGNAVEHDARRYITLYEVVDYMENVSEWGSKKKDELSNKKMRKIPHIETFEEFTDVAKNGEISVLGRLNDTGLHQAIPGTFWLVGTFDMNTFIRRQISQTKAVLNQRGIPLYTDLKFSRADVYRAWPRAK